MTKWAIFQGASGLTVLPKSAITDQKIIHEFEAKGLIEAHKYKKEFKKEIDTNE